MKFNDLPMELQDELLKQSKDISVEMGIVDDLLDMDAWNIPLTDVCDKLLKVNDALLKITKLNLSIVSALDEYSNQLATESGQAELESVED